MKRIEIDSEVFTYLQKHSEPFVDTPNSTLRRLLGIEGGMPSVKPGGATLSSDKDVGQPLTESIEVTRHRSQNADLEVLAKAGTVRNGEKLYLIDYQGNRVPKLYATISGRDLAYNGQRYSMSKLAREFLAKFGFRSKHVRGPAHWITKDGKLIKDLWQQYLEQNDQK